MSKKIKLKSANYIEAPLSGGEWKSKKGNETSKYFDLPYKPRSERKGRL